MENGIHSPHNACCYRDKCRQQADRIAELEKELEEYEELEQNYMKAIQRLQSKTPQTKPLTNDEIENMAFNFVHEDDELDIFGFARAIEERHGIK